ncbi:MAG: AraC family transcriptional regulator [Spirochaetales bacterium]|nr:AraC family transcriptional regulator [Spirochaetales bacterium]
MELGKYYGSRFCPEFIDAYWVYRCKSEKSIRSRIFPQGLSNLIFYFNESKQTGTCLDNGFPYIFVNGEITGPLPVAYRKNEFFIVAHIKSFYLHALLNINMESITDKIVSLEDIDKKLYRRLRSCAAGDSPEESLRAIDRELYLIFREISAPAAGLAEVMDLAYSTRGICSLDELLERGNMSARTLERNFLKTVGVPPKTLTRIIRFNNILHHLKARKKCSLIETALDFGYYDQAHFNNDFKKISGYAPSFFISS